ncbi:ATPase family associated with various cellular activities AAA [Nitzschia inconspicua]|uniref:ATPase family associated with various cellular activities AAA n=1 Tax=Nitzschia inconspicua TaxID=303405 RepID=A0A9K3PN57_9STRA|nr:ATPase family associated with various cellular activities AAA [Nitzschia inconspicua]
MLTTRTAIKALLRRRSVRTAQKSSPQTVRCVQGLSSKNDEEEYLDLIRKEIEIKGGEIYAGNLGRIPKPESVLHKPMHLVKLTVNPDRFRLQAEGSGLWISLVEHGDDQSSESETDECAPPTYTLVETVDGLFKAVEMLENEKECLTVEGKVVFAVDMERSSELETLQIASTTSVVIVDCRSIERENLGSALKNVLSSGQYIKLIHDDKSTIQPGKNRMGYQMNVENRNPFDFRPIQHEDLLYAAYDVSCLIKAKDYIWSKFQASSIQKLMLATSLRIEDALQNGSKRSICFDKKNDFRLSSSEIFRVLSGEKAYYGRPTVIIANLDDVVDILPDDIGAALVDDKFMSTHVSDIALDIGRRPVAMMPGMRQDLCTREVSQNDIEYIVSKLAGGFGRDGRAAMPGSLNRVSAIRGKDGMLLGITFRIGRTIHNRSDLLLDFILGTEKSILVLGKPASGKTSVIRDVARILSQTRNVVVIDKSNEIAGDSVVPHESIESSRRMMVPTGKTQQDVMIECIENHAPQVMVIDEIGNPMQVTAARTAKDRGVRMIATAHGDLCGLIDNPSLNGLVGGIDTIPISDAMASLEQDRRIRNKNALERGFCCQRRQSPPKLKTQRVSQPIFDVIVEVTASDKNAMKVVPDTARAVDDVLANMPYFAHMRFKDPDTGLIFYEFPETFCARTSTVDSQEKGIDLEGE